MKEIRILALAGSLALLSGCMASDTPGQDAADPAVQQAPVKGPVLRDPDNNPVLEVPVDLLQDIRRQMIENGRTEDLKDLEAAYDFKTGKIRGPVK